ncbi:peroxiredoxin-like family protein [Salinisphaera sp. RV14]|uniref:peroxiredoxin-like family protein n=1 Tax=Salinisphaera sp. RV14 TaxID=3454140 RepID=UPI003F857365
MPSLTSSLAAMRIKFAKTLPAKASAVTNAHFEHLRAQAMDGIKKIGDRAPTFELRDGTGQMVSSAALLSNGPLVVSFTRGSWCPYCTEEVKALNAAYEQFRALGAELVVISPQTQERAAKQTQAMGLKFSVLSDEKNATAKAFGLAYQLPDDLKDVYQHVFKIDLSRVNAGAEWTLPIPARLVIDRQSVIRDIKADPDYRYRPEPSDTVAVLRAL